jgi:DMSO/TMAO reductase YedYZ molybdopterin-dependent catalytic subunit
MPVTQWLDDAVPSIDASEWRLLVTSGGVSRSVSLDELAAFDDRTRAVLDCTGGWYAEQVWQGARLDRLLGQVDGSSVLVRSRTGYERRFPIGDASSIVVATGVGGAQLSAGHGFPARLVAPGRRGYWWVKWIDEIRVDDTPWWWQPPFPLT